MRSTAVLFALRRSAYVPLALVLASVIALAVMPVFLHRKVDTYLNDITGLVEPARKAVSDMQIALALETAGTRGYLLTGNEHFAKSHLEARAGRRQAYARLRELQPRLGPEVGRTLDDLDRDFRPSDALLDALFSRRMSRDEFLSYLPAQQARFQTVTATTARLHDVIRQEAAVRRKKVGDAQDFGSILVAIGVVLSLAALASVARLSMTQLELARQERQARATIEKAHAEAEDRRRELEHLTASRERLVRGFSHDLKNPLGAADGYLFMLEQGVAGTLSGPQQEFVRKARRSVGTTVHLIEDLLELVRAEKGDIELHMRPIDLRAIAERVVEDYRAHAEAKALALGTDLPSSLPPVVSDPERVHQVLGNLVSNAVKYTQVGRVTVRVATRRSDSGINHAVVDVVDTGPGISPEHQSAIFDEFHRADAPEDAAGAGIGLAISRQLAIALGGSVTLESQMGQGATFTLWLPIDVSAAPAGAPSNAT